MLDKQKQQKNVTTNNTNNKAQVYTELCSLLLLLSKTPKQEKTTL